MSAGAERHGRSVLRYTFGERVGHFLAGVSYLYLLLTGLALWTPALYWLAIVLGGGYLSRALHSWVGIVFVATVAWMFLAWNADMRTTAADRAWRTAIWHYIRNEDDRVPDADRFNYGQKQFFWLMLWCTLALLMSGLVIWVPQAIPSELIGVRQAAVLVHAVAALFTIGGFIVHVYMGVAVVPGGLRAIINGEVSEEWARSHHPRWLAEIAGAKLRDDSKLGRSI